MRILNPSPPWLAGNQGKDMMGIDLQAFYCGFYGNFSHILFLGYFKHVSALLTLY